MRSGNPLRLSRESLGNEWESFACDLACGGLGTPAQGVSALAALVTRFAALDAIVAA